MVVVTVVENGRDVEAIQVRAQTYLEEHGLHATFVQKESPAAEAILETVTEYKRDLLIIGGYGASPVLEIVLGSTLDQVLRTTRKPILICR